jgi:hypothetical protein
LGTPLAAGQSLLLIRLSDEKSPGLPGLFAAGNGKRSIFMQILPNAMHAGIGGNNSGAAALPVCLLSELGHLSKQTQRNPP